MPNWTSVEFSVEGKDAGKLLSLARKSVEEGTRGFFDRILPMPKTYKEYDTTNYRKSDCESRMGYGYNELKEGEKIFREGKEILVTKEYIEKFGRAVKYQKKKYGEIGWLNWRCSNWGTKWDAADLFVDGDTISFLSAWCFPEEIFSKIAKKFDVEIDGYFDNGCGGYEYFAISNHEMSVRREGEKANDYSRKN